MPEYEIVNDVRGASTSVVRQERMSVVKDHQATWPLGIVLSWHVDPVGMLSALVNLTR